MTHTVDLAGLTAADMMPQIGATFVASLDGSVVDHMVLSAVEPGRPTPAGKEAFSLYFVGAPGTELPQAVYSLEALDGARLDVFLVPIGESSEGRRFEAVFN